MSENLVVCPQCGKINNIEGSHAKEHVFCKRCSFKGEKKSFEHICFLYKPNKPKKLIIRALSEEEESERLKIFEMNTEMPRFIFNKLPLEQRNAINIQNNQRLIGFINKLSVYDSSI